MGIQKKIFQSTDNTVHIIELRLNTFPGCFVGNKKVHQNIIVVKNTGPFILTTLFAQPFHQL